MSYYSAAENKFAAAQIAIRQETNRRLIIVVVIILITVLLAIFIYLYFRVLAAVKKTPGGSGGGNGGGGNGGAVIGCTSDTQCPISTPKCDTASKTCVICLDSNDCSGNVTVCNTTTHTCVQCIDNNTCFAGEQCKTDIGQCVECFTASDCGANGYCVNNVCFICNNIPPSTITNAVVTAIGCTAYNVNISWTSVPDATSYNVQLTGFDTGNNAVSVRALGVTGTSVSGLMTTIFTDAPQGYPTKCNGNINVQVQSILACGTSPYTSPVITTGSIVCCQ